ncbi:helix-turn-helix domain-containing protein [Enterococcus sp.]|uniref:helix-turn-helix domain-containing protein n=1 Tax=Enterococcus sp. TaxID=35783 RepID=UPI002FCBB6AB
MFGFSKEVTIKKEIILFLDDQEQAITNDEIAKQIQTVKSSTIRRHLKDVEKAIGTLYPPEQANLQICHRQGIQLFRQSDELEQVLEELYKNDTVYDVYKYLLLYGIYSSDLFCKEHDISLSTLRRIVNRMNVFLSPYQIRIRLGKKMRIIGESAQIRLVFFMFFYSIHRGFSREHWGVTSKYIDLSKQICQQFSLAPQDASIEILALWLFINQKLGVENDAIQSVYVEDWYKDITLPEKEMPKEMWNYVLLVMYALGFFEFEPKLTFERLHENRFSEMGSKWLTLFEKHVRFLTTEEREIINKMTYKYSVIESVLPTFRETNEIMGLTKKEHVEIEYPYFKHLFSKIWAEFIAVFPEKNTASMREILASISFGFMTEDELFPVVSFCWSSRFSSENLKQMEKIIQFKLTDRANIVFVEDVETSDFTLSTESSTKGIFVTQNLSNRDIDILRNELHNWVVNA